VTRRVAVVGGGWAGLAAAVEACSRGHAVSLFEMSAQLGGRARKVDLGDTVVDNGQHILIGAYLQTLALMRRVGVTVDEALLRTPLALVGPDGGGLVLPRGAAVPAFARAVLTNPHWGWRDRFSLLGAATGWALRGFRCAPRLSVAELCAGIRPRVLEQLIEPLCVAALNTPAHQASAGVFLRVLKDALFSGAGSADLLLPRRHLSALLPEPAGHWLTQAGAELRLGQRVMSIAAGDGGWSVDGERFDAVVLAAPALEAARLARPHAAAWADAAEALRYQPIVTVYAQSLGSRLPRPMIALSSPPAQYVFDLGQLRAQPGWLAFVISGAQPWVERGMEATALATLAQAREELGAHLGEPLSLRRALTEKRATFCCTPELVRPAQRIAPGLVAAADYCEGPYPATLEGAVRSGLAAIDGLSA